MAFFYRIMLLNRARAALRLASYLGHIRSRTLLDNHKSVNEFGVVRSSLHAGIVSCVIGVQQYVVKPTVADINENVLSEQLVSESSLTEELVKSSGVPLQTAIQKWEGVSGGGRKGPNNLSQTPPWYEEKKLGKLFSALVKSVNDTALQNKRSLFAGKFGESSTSGEWVTLLPACSPLSDSVSTVRCQIQQEMRTSVYRKLRNTVSSRQFCDSGNRCNNLTKTPYRNTHSMLPEPFGSLLPGIRRKRNEMQRMPD
ncbi:unnamed protein product [Bemisia tabaci]|uniref:Uncharacterized protein n=1 Tax=Bemisia tabaci TaxID=7038 RepID=A0A9P0F3S2_BEMTA|nr:unnamed protein product [Bemisia tabaci]